MLTGCRGKIARAESHLEALKAQQRVFLESRPYVFGSHFDSDSRCYEFHLADITFLPQDWALMVGDYLHNLRSALDHLAWQLATLHYGREPTNREGREIAFPIASDYTAFITSKALRHLHFSHVTTIERFQPYHGGGSPQPLAFLRDFSNTDKHRVLHAAVIRLSDAAPLLTLNEDAGVMKDVIFHTRDLIYGEKILSVKLEPVGPEPKVDLHHLAVDIAFGRHRASVKIEQLPVMLDAVRTVVRGCEHFFIPTH